MGLYFVGKDRSKKWYGGPIFHLLGTNSVSSDTKGGFWSIKNSVGDQSRLKWGFGLFLGSILGQN